MLARAAAAALPALRASSAAPSLALQRSVARALSTSGGDASSHPYLTGSARYMPGFSFPAPRRLDQIIQYALLERESPEDIRRIWGEYHGTRTDSVASFMTKAQWGEMKNYTKANPMFIFPVFKGEGKYFMVVSQFQDDHCIFTYLEDYKKNPAAAEPYMALSYFSDFAERKDTILIRGDFSGHITKGEAAALLRSLNMHYLDSKRREYVEAFNHRPAEFDFARYMEKYPADI